MRSSMLVKLFLYALVSGSAVTGVVVGNREAAAWPIFVPPPPPPPTTPPTTICGANCYGHHPYCHCRPSIGAFDTDVADPFGLLRNAP